MKITMICLLVLISALLCVACEKTTELEKVLVLSILTESGSYPDSMEIVVSCNIDGADIRYTINGSDPDLDSEAYSSPIKIGDIVNPEMNFVSFKAKAFRDDCISSLTVSREYSCISEHTVVTPEISLALETGQAMATLSLSCATPDAMIRYTINGTELNNMSPIYQHPITISRFGTIVIKAKAFKQDWIPSECAERWFFILHPAQDMVLIEGGDVVIDTLNARLNSYYMDKREVSQTDYYTVMASADDVYLPSKGDYPVYYVSWFDAVAYCNKRSLLERITPCYTYNNTSVTNPDSWPEGWNTNDANSTNISCNWDAPGYRLPTEMEWMFAASGGALGHNYQFSGCDSIYSVAWYDENSGSSVHEVATKEPNELGIYDLSGNLSEWCWDIFAPYPSGPQVNPHGPSTGSQRVIRGGSWYSPEEMCQVTARSSGLPTQNQAASIGFRCVKKQWILPLSQGKKNK
ncbi:MAG: hypothetical protein CVU48_08280 [Candidatus Cloacimonetes bacterium HGW-Cloacimonetes-1]|jgi:hypothetical protein|nr:MAG: hypothetical protein CVU48_08280 [Candidatus Cloacimonetes bacterium HGW-Cloacimonetes-1]